METVILICGGSEYDKKLENGKERRYIVDWYNDDLKANSTSVTFDVYQLAMSQKGQDVTARLQVQRFGKDIRFNLIEVL